MVVYITLKAWISCFVMFPHIYRTWHHNFCKLPSAKYLIIEYTCKPKNVYPLNNSIWILRACRFNVKLNIKPTFHRPWFDINTWNAVISKLKQFLYQILPTRTKYVLCCIQSYRYRTSTNNKKTRQICWSLLRSYLKAKWNMR